jgi:hypothetical protein
MRDVMRRNQLLCQCWATGVRLEKLKRATSIEAET